METQKIAYLFIVACIGKSFSVSALTWNDLKQKSEIYLYAGDCPLNEHYTKHIGLSLWYNDNKHIQHDITNPMLLPEGCVDTYQTEDVFEHIEYSKLVDVINEIFRVLKPNGLLRISVPDYRFDTYYSRCLKDLEGRILFDPGGGGRYVNGKVVNGGHLWFPTIEQVSALLEKTKFFTHGKIEFLHYYDTNGVSITKPIDYSKGYVCRTPDHDKRGKSPYRAISIVVDLYKKSTH